MGKLKEILEGALAEIGKARKDFATIEVTTLTGDFGQTFNGEGEVDLKAALNKLKDGNGTGSIKVVAHTRIEFDLDAINYVSSDAIGQSRELFDLHKDAVASAQTARQNFLHFIKDFLGQNA